jgi:hypothetical protein
VAPTDSSAPSSARRKAERRWSPHLLASGSLPHVWRMFRRFGREIDRPYLARAAAIPVAALLHAPFAAAESLLTRRRIDRQQLADPLVMIIGHWRSGTTNVHNYLLQDPRFACVSLLHCLAPHEFLTLGRLSRRLLRHLVLSKRPMDNVRTRLDEPMSEDFALVGVTDQTHYLGYFFPRLLEETFAETVLFDGVSPARIDRWAADFERLLKKVTLAAGGRPLVLKNPANTGRIRQLASRFPQMRFVCVHRDPQVVHASTCRLMERFLDRWALQRHDPQLLQQALLRRHARLLERYFEDRQLLSPGRLVEIAHEDMVGRPVETLESVYRRLDLGDFDAVRPRVQQYAAAVADYRPNEYAIDPVRDAAVAQALGPLYQRWGRHITPAVGESCSPSTVSVSEPVP